MANGWKSDEITRNERGSVRSPCGAASLLSPETSPSLTRPAIELDPRGTRIMWVRAVFATAKKSSANALAVHLGVPIQLKPYDNPVRTND